MERTKYRSAVHTRRVVAGKFPQEISPHVETAPMEQLIPTREALARQFMKNYILHYTNRRDMKLPFDESGLVWTAQSIVLPSIPGKLLQGNFYAGNLARTLRLLQRSN